MILPLELLGAFLAGIGFTLVMVAVVGKWYLRRKLGGLIDLTGSKAKGVPVYSSSPTVIAIPDHWKQDGD